MILPTIDSVVLKYGRLYVEELRGGNRSRVYTHCTQTARNGFLRWDQAYRVSLFPSMHLTGNHIFTLHIFLCINMIHMYSNDAYLQLIELIDVQILFFFYFDTVCYHRILFEFLICGTFFFTFFTNFCSLITQYL